MRRAYCSTSSSRQLLSSFLFLEPRLCFEFIYTSTHCRVLKQLLCFNIHFPPFLHSSLYLLKYISDAMESPFGVKQAWPISFLNKNSSKFTVEFGPKRECTILAPSGHILRHESNSSPLSFKMLTFGAFWLSKTCQDAAQNWCPVTF